jgi:hypothetical protein
MAPTVASLLSNTEMIHIFLVPPIINHLINRQHNLIKSLHRKQGDDSVRFVDDTTIIAEGRDLHEAFNKLTDDMTRPAGPRATAATAR